MYDFLLIDNFCIIGISFMKNFLGKILFLFIKLMFYF